MRLSLLCAVALLTLSIFPGSVSAQAVNIMPVGDSITQGVRGQCGYRRVLSQALAANPQCAVGFVGSRTAVGFSSSNEVLAACEDTNTNHESRPGARADFYIPNELSNRVSAFEPDIVVIHAGSNDLFQGETVSSTVNDVAGMIDAVFSSKPSATVLLLNVIPWSEVSPNPSEFRGFNQASVDMLQVTAQLSSQLETLAIQRQAAGEAVVLVDVREGFDSNTMTIDGVHPNNNGENHIAYRVLDALYAQDICGNTESPFPSFTLPSSTWAQISLPGNPGSMNTVADIFDELPFGSYANQASGDGWIVWAYNGVDYTQLSLNSVMVPGDGYWIIQLSNSAVTITMPPGSTPTLQIESNQCASPSGCFAVDLPNVSTSPIPFNMPGYPLAVEQRFSDTRIRTLAGDCANGCTPTQAESNDIIFNLMFQYDPSAPDALPSGYREVQGNDILSPWEAYWSANRPGAVNNSPEWLIGPD